MNIKELADKIEALKPAVRSTFSKGVLAYASEMLDCIIAGDYNGVNGDSDVSALDLGHLVNHVDGNGMKLNRKWTEAELNKCASLCRASSFGGNFLISASSIVERLFPKSKRTAAVHNNSCVHQADALKKAVLRIKGIVMAAA